MTFDEAFIRLAGNEDLDLERDKALYKRDYWGPAGCEGVPASIKFLLFDLAVTHGVETAIRALQHAAGVTQDGILGPRTLQAVQAMPADHLLFRFTAARFVA